MCAIFGMMLKNNFDTNNIHRVKSTLYGIMAKSKARGRDGIGIEFELADGRRTSRKFTKCNQTNIHRLVGMIPFEAGQILIGNCRAEPTTEYIKNRVRKINNRIAWIIGLWFIMVRLLTTIHLERVKWIP